MDGKLADIPQPRELPILGHALEIGGEGVVDSLARLAREQGPIYRLTFPGQSLLVVTSHALASELCDQTRFHKHLHGPLRELRPLAGDGLFTAAHGEENWGRAHRLLMPVFGALAMPTYFEPMLDIADQMLTRWERLGPDAVHDVPDQMTRLTLDTLALSAFDYRFNSFYGDEMHPFVDAMVRALVEAGERPRRPKVVNAALLGRKKRFEEDVQLMFGITDELVARRRARLPDGDGPNDLLQRMLTSADPLTGERLSDENIRYQLITFLIAGHETTSGLLSYATYRLIRHPDVWARLQAQVDEVLGDRMPTQEDMARLPFVDQVLKETLRLHPTAPAFAVEPKEDTIVGGRYAVRKGEELLVALAPLHRDPAVWPDPEAFRPERFAPDAPPIPANAWMPFGSGERACIGRQFALAEARLVLAMMAQRFDIAFDGSYTLRNKETLTIKPDGLRIRVRQRKAIRRAPAPTSAVDPVEAPSVAVHGTPLCILFGTNAGASEGFARKLAGQARARGYDPTVAPLDEGVDALPREGAVLVVTASYNGQPPDNAARFWRWVNAQPAGSLQGVRFAVLGCGNRDWVDTYQAIPRGVDAALAAAGATRVAPRGEADAAGDFFGDVDRWSQALWPRLADALGVDDAATSGPGLQLEVVPDTAVDLHSRHQLVAARVVDNRELVDMTSPLGRSKRHLQLRLPEGVTYRAGDYLAVLPENDPERVAVAVRRFGLTTDTTVRLSGGDDGGLPMDRPVRLGELLSRHVELSTPATRADLTRLAAVNPCPPHRDHLQALADDEAIYKAEILDKRTSVLDLLVRYPSCDLPLADFLQMLPPMRVRQYSISSTPLEAADECSLTVAVVDAPAWSGEGRFRGTCSTHLARRMPGDELGVAVRAPHTPFRPPEDNGRPLVLVCAGSGLAPFRGFLRERARRHDDGESAGPSMLLFGCDHPDVDFLYRDEWSGFQDDGWLTVCPAFFQQPDGEVMFVQHRLWQERDAVWRLLDDDGVLMICGDGQRMAPAVRQTLLRMRAERAGSTEEEAEAWLRALEREGRYVVDVFA